MTALLCGVLLGQSAPAVRLNPGPDWVVFDAKGAVISGGKGVPTTRISSLRRQITGTEFGGNARLILGAGTRTGGAIARLTTAPQSLEENAAWEALEKRASRYRRDNEVAFRTVEGRRWFETRAKGATRLVQWTTFRGKETITLTLSWPDARQDGLLAKGRTWLAHIVPSVRR